MDSMSGCEIRPKTEHCSKKNAYTSEITFLALNPRFKFIKFGPMEGLSLVKFVIRYYQEVLIKNNLQMGTQFLFL